MKKGFSRGIVVFGTVPFTVIRRWWSARTARLNEHTPVQSGLIIPANNLIVVMIEVLLP